MLYTFDEWIKRIDKSKYTKWEREKIILKWLSLDYQEEVHAIIFCYCCKEHRWLIDTSHGCSGIKTFPYNIVITNFLTLMEKQHVSQI